jgi:hypothetical protein
LGLQFSGGASSIVNNPRLNTDSGAVLSGSATVVSVGDYWRIAATITNDGSGHTTLRVTLSPAAAAHGLTALDPSITGSAIVWGAQLEPGSTAGTIANLARVYPGDMLQAGQNLLMVGGSTFTSSDSAGNMAVPLVLPLQLPLTVDTPIVTSSATGLWELDTDSIDMEYVAPRLQLPLVLPFRQVVL